MPPDPLSWDRKDFFKERKHERLEPHHYHPHPIGGGGAVGGGGYGGVGGFGGGPRWREPPHLHPHPYHYDSPRWVPDFRYRPPPGYGKQGGRHLYPEESSHGFVPSRPSDRMYDDESYRASGSGKYSRINRENRGPFAQKDWKGQSWEATPSPSGPGRPNDQLRSVDDVLNSASSHPHLDSANSWDQSHLKDQHEKSNGVNTIGSSGQRLERENSLGSIDWKFLKWTRSGSLSSRGSGFSHSSSSKSMGSEFNEMKSEVEPINVTPVQTPSGDAVTPAPTSAACESSADPSEETSSRKKPRLGWGEGLAKYERKRVEGVDDIGMKNGTVICSSSREPVHLNSSHLADKSPRITGFSDCASPTTPSSVGCSSSAGLEGKQSVKGGNVDHDTSDISLSPGLVSQNHIIGSTFDLENLDLAQSDHLNSAINELLQSDDPSSVDSTFVKSTAINKLLVWKGDVLKKLEMTESQIDRLEVELKSLTFVPESSCPHPAISSSLPADCLSKPTEEQDASSNTTRRPALLDLVLSGDNEGEKMPDVREDEHAKAKDEDVDSPGSATSKYFEVPSSGKDAYPSEQQNHVKGFLNTDIDRSADLELRCLGYSVHEDKEGEISARCDGFQLDASSPTHVGEIILHGDREHKLCESILASNKEIANRVVEVFNKLLPTNLATFDISSVATVSSLESNSMVKEKYLRRKRFLEFKERFISLKFRALQYFWKEDIPLLSMRKFRVKSHKKLDLSLPMVHSSSRKYRSSVRSRLSSVAGNLSSAPSTEMINIISKLLSDSQVKPCRDTLKMPALILDKEDKMVSRFISSNGLVEDPCADEKARSMINPWTSEERGIFMQKLTEYGKDFTKIATFLVHKTTADCIEFYYKNHKSDCFKIIKKHPDFAKKGKIFSANNYLVASGKRWNCEANAASLDILGAASAIAANVDDGMEIQQKCTSKYLLGRSSDYKTSKGDSGLLERSSSLDVDTSERETVAADVLAGICGSLSSEAMGSCITSAVDPGEGYHKWKCQRVGSSRRWPWITEITQNVDDETCSDESCGEMDPTDWTDEEKSIFIQAVSSYGKDFTMISRCVSSRSGEQCKIFFSKARKRLGLDMICPGSCNVVRDDVHGGSSDTDDAFVVETGSFICSEKSGVKMEVDLPSPEVKLNSGPYLAGTTNAKPDLNQSEENNGPGDLDAVLLSKNLIQMEDKPEQELDVDVADIRTVPSSAPIPVEVQGTVTVPTREAEQLVGKPCDHAKIRSDTRAESGAVDKLAGHLAIEMKGVSPVSMESSMNDRKEKDDANLSVVSGLHQDLKSALQIPINSSNKASVTNSSSGCGGVSGDQQMAEMESDSARGPRGIPLQQNSFAVPMDSVSQVSAVNCGKTPNEGTSSTLCVGKTSGQQGHQVTGAGEKLPSGSSLLDNVDSAQILRGYPVPSSTREINSDSSCRRSVTLQNIPKLDNNFDHDRHLARDSYLQKCNGVKYYSSRAELPFKFRDQSRGSNPSYHLGGSSDVEKPRWNGGVKLFGQIITKPPSQKKSSSSIQQNGDNENQQSKIGKPFSTKFTGDQAIGESLSRTKLDRKNFLASENLPVRSFGFRDGSRIQTGFHSLPDSAILLAKYPAAFGNYAMASSKMEQLPLHGVNNGEQSLNGSAVFPAREIGGSNTVGDYQAYRNRELQHFTLDMKQRQDAVQSDMQRMNGFDVVSGMQQQARGMGGINVVGRGGILVRGQCTGISDPVAAIKMHYSKAEQLIGGQAGSIIREDDSWRGKGNIGR